MGDRMTPEPENRLTVAIIGAGPLGRSLAWRAARAGFRVLLEDVLPSNLHQARRFIRSELEAQKMAGAAENPAAVPNRDATPGPLPLDSSPTPAPEEAFAVAFVSSIEDAVRSAELVIECVPDELESKLEILWLLDRMAPPHAVFATPTTALSIADLAACTNRPGQCVALAAAPAALARLESGDALELRTTPATTPGTVALVDRFWRALGFNPVFRPAPQEPL